MLASCARTSGIDGTDASMSVVPSSRSPGSPRMVATLMACA